APRAVPSEAGDGARGRRSTAVAGPDAALARLAARRRRRALPARRARADQPDLVVGAVPHVAGDERRAARLVSGLADRRAAADARLGFRDRQVHGRAESL